MIEYLLFLIGIFLLVKGADYLVEGSTLLARKLRVSTLLVGLTIVAFGTSTPELFVNILSALNGSSDIAFGNIIGSNIANILLVLGIVAIMHPIKISHSTIWREIPFSFLAAVVLFVVSNYFLTEKIGVVSLTKVSGLILISFFILFIFYVYISAKKTSTKLNLEDLEIKGRPNYSIFLMIIGGLIALYFGGMWVVAGAVSISELLGMSQFLISATIVAIGTSLPELATGITAARKKDTELAVGNSIGSNVFNIFWIMGVTSLISPIGVPGFVNFDILFLMAITFLVFIFLFIGKKHELERWQGVLFVILYVVYILYIVQRG